MSNRFTRRRMLAASAGAAALSATGQSFAQSAIKTADASPPKLEIEQGAKLRILRPVRFVPADEEVFRENCARFTQQTGVEVRVDFVGWEDITQQTAVTANTGAGPDIIIGFNEAPHIYVDKLVDQSDVAEYLGKKYGGWLPLAERYGKQHGTDNWISLPIGASGGPLVWRKSALQEVGFDAPPDDHANYLKLCKSLSAAGKPSGFALGNAVGDGNGFANWLVWSHGGYLVDDDGNVAINSPETINALNYIKELYPTFAPGTLAWGDISNNRAYSSSEIWMTANGVSLYLSLLRKPEMAALAEDTYHSLLPTGTLDVSPMSGTTLNAMVFKHSDYPNAAKSLIQFLLEKEQYDPWLQGSGGYWAQPLAAYADSDAWKGDPKMAIFRDVMKSNFWIGYKGPISAGSAAANADYVMVQMCASVASGEATPKQAAAEAERRARRFFRRR